MPFQFKQFSVMHSRSTLKVGTDAMLLGAHVKPIGQKILEIGTGCGIIALMLAQKCEAMITAIDIHRPSIEEATLNALNSPWADQIEVQHTSLQELSKSSQEKFDHIITNPPFFSDSLLPTSSDKEIAKHTSYLDFDSLLHCSKELLAKDGLLSVIIPFDTANNFKLKASATGLFPFESVHIQPKKDKEYNRVIITFSSSKGIEKQHKLIIRNQDNSYSEEYKELTKEFHLDF